MGRLSSNVRRHYTTVVHFPSPLPELRRATHADASAVTECVHAGYAHWVSVVGMKPGPMLQNYEEVLAKEQVFVAEAACKVVGVLVLSVTGEGFLLENVAVHPMHAGLGLGRRLLALAEQEAVAQGHASIHLYTHERMTENVALYRKLGYQEYARRTEHGFARVYMRKVLNDA